MFPKIKNVNMVHVQDTDDYSQQKKDTDDYYLNKWKHLSYLQIT